MEETDLSEADLTRAHLEGAHLGKVKSFYKTKLDPVILSAIKTKWPEKLATLFNVKLMDWVIDTTLLEKIKKPDWHGW
jgi:uncharacterized protein YjbI with pentapeptide repeats